MKMLDVPQSGSQAGTTSSRNRYGQYKRTRATPAQPRTDKQTAVRANLAELSQAWRELTDDQRTAWKAWADAHPRNDSLGQTIFMTGHQAYVSVNTTLRQAEGSTTQEPPEDFEVSAPYVKVIGDDVTNLMMLIAPSDPLCRSVLFASPPVSAGISFIGDYRQVGVATNDDTVYRLVDFGALLLAKYGSLATGKRYGYRWYYENSGLKSANSTNSVVVRSYDGPPFFTDSSALALTPSTGFAAGDTLEIYKQEPDPNLYNLTSTVPYTDDPITVAAGSYRVIAVRDGVRIGITPVSVVPAV